MFTFLRKATQNGETALVDEWKRAMNTFDFNCFKVNRRTKERNGFIQTRWFHYTHTDLRSMMWYGLQSNPFPTPQTPLRYPSMPPHDKCETLLRVLHSFRVACDIAFMHMVQSYMSADLSMPRELDWQARVVDMLGILSSFCQWRKDEGTDQVNNDIDWIAECFHSIRHLQNTSKGKPIQDFVFDIDIPRASGSQPGDNVWTVYVELKLANNHYKHPVTTKGKTDFWDKYDNSCSTYFDTKTLEQRKKCLFLFMQHVEVEVGNDVVHSVLPILFTNRWDPKHTIRKEPKVRGVEKYNQLDDLQDPNFNFDYTESNTARYYLDLFNHYTPLVANRELVRLHATTEEMFKMGYTNYPAVVPWLFKLTQTQLETLFKIPPETPRPGKRKTTQERFRQKMNRIERYRVGRAFSPEDQALLEAVLSMLIKE